MLRLAPEMPKSDSPNSREGWEGGKTETVKATILHCFSSIKGRVPQHRVPQQPSRCSLMRALSTPSLIQLREPHPQLLIAVGRCRALTHGAISHGCRQPWAGAGPLPTAIFLMTPDSRGQVQGPYPRLYFNRLYPAVGRCRALTHGYSLSVPGGTSSPGTSNNCGCSHPQLLLTTTVDR